MLPRKPGQATDGQVAFAHLKKQHRPRLCWQVTLELVDSGPASSWYSAMLPEPTTGPEIFQHPAPICLAFRVVQHTSYIFEEFVLALHTFCALLHLLLFHENSNMITHTKHSSSCNEPLSPPLCSTSCSLPHTSTCSPTLTSSLIFSRLPPSPALSHSRMPAPLPCPAASMPPPASYTATPRAATS